MKRNLKQRYLTGLCALALVGLTACAVSQTGGGASEMNIQLESPTPLPEQVNEVQPESRGTYTCAEGDMHSIGQSITTTYEVSYEQVMTWFCSGYSFENILIALETNEAVDVPAELLLQMLQEKEWEEIWVEVGFTDGQ